MFFYAVHMLEALFGFERIRLTKTKPLIKTVYVQEVARTCDSTSLLDVF